MLTVISRKAIFQSSVFVDNYIAEIQQSYAANFDKNNNHDVSILKKYYDHLKPFQPINTSTHKLGVIAYSAKNKKDYQINFTLQIQHLLLSLNINKIWLMQFLQTNVAVDFPFENFSKKNTFKRLGGINSNQIIYQFSTNSLHNILPLFFFSKQYDAPVIILFAANKPLALRLCDDGNFHFEITDQMFQQFSTIATNYHLIVDNEKICSHYSLFYFNKANEQGNFLGIENV